MNATRRTAAIRTGLIINLDLDSGLEPLADVLRRFIARRLTTALGAELWRVTSVHAKLCRDPSGVVTCRVCVVLHHKTAVAETATAPDLQTAVDVAVERIGRSPRVRTVPWASGRAGVRPGR